jgi:hypothetical protein
MIDPRDTVFFVPPGLKKFKLNLFETIAKHISDLGGSVVKHDFKALEKAADNKIPIIGCSPPFAEAIERWQADGTKWIYWDRGYLRRVFATWLPKGSDMGIPGGFYRWHINEFQMMKIRDVPDDRWRALQLEDCVKPWRENGEKILIADTLPEYWQLRRLGVDWSHKLAAELRRKTKRPVVVREKLSAVPLYQELEGAHALVAHGSIAAVESVVWGFPVFVDKSCTAALMGETDLDKLEEPRRPAREKWLHSLAYCQFTEKELCDGTLWRLIE